jgi:hypothetical protein
MVPCLKPFLPNEWKGKPIKGNFEAVKEYLEHCRSTHLAPYGVTQVGPFRGRHMGHLLLTLESVEQANTFIQLWNSPEHPLPLKTFIDLTTNASTHAYAVLAPPELLTFLTLEQASRLMDQVYPLGIRPRTRDQSKPPGSPMNSRKRPSPSPASSPQARWAREDRDGSPEIHIMTPGALRTARGNKHPYRAPRSPPPPVNERWQLALAQALPTALAPLQDDNRNLRSVVNNFDRRLKASEDAAKAAQTQHDLLRAENAALRAETDRLKQQQADDRTHTDERMEALHQAQQGMAQVLALLSKFPPAAPTAQATPKPDKPNAMDTSNGGSGN